MKSDAGNVEAYLAELPGDRREAIAAVRDVILANLPDGVVESMNWGMIAYEIPLARYPDTYNGQPLMVAALASQKNYMAVYLQCVYSIAGGAERFEAAYRATGKRLDMGKGCVRFRTLDALPLDVVGEAVGSVDVDTFIRTFEEAQRAAKARRASRA